MKVIQVKPKAGYRLKLKLDTGKEIEYDFTPWLQHKQAKVLRDAKLFSKVDIDKFGGVFWPNGFDICPEVLMEETFSS